MANLKNSSLDLSNFTIAIVYDGSSSRLGFMTAKFLVESGIKKILLFGKSSSNEREPGNDFTKLKLQLKLEAQKHPVEIRILNYEDLSCESNYSEFVSKLKVPTNSKEQSDVNNAVDLLLCFVDEDEIKIGVNSACNELGLSWMDCGFDKSNQVGHVRLIRPGELACLLCLPNPGEVDAHEKVDKKAEDETTSAAGDGNYVHLLSHKTKLCIMADLFSQTVTKYFRHFENEGPIPSAFVKYSTGKDEYTEIITLQPNADCKDVNCIGQQHKVKRNMVINMVMTNPLVIKNMMKHSRKSFKTLRLVCKLWNELVISQDKLIVSTLPCPNVPERSDANFTKICQGMNPKLARSIIGTPGDAFNNFQALINTFNTTVSHISVIFTGKYYLVIPLWHRLLQNHCPNATYIELIFCDDASTENLTLNGFNSDARNPNWIPTTPNYLSELKPLKPRPTLGTLTVVYDSDISQNINDSDISKNIRKFVIFPMETLTQLLLNAAPNVTKLEIKASIMFPDCSKNNKISVLSLISERNFPVGPQGFDCFSPKRLSNLLSQVSATVKHLTLPDLELIFKKFSLESKRAFEFPPKMPQLSSYFCIGAGHYFLKNSDQFLQSVMGLGDKMKALCVCISPLNSKDVKPYKESLRWMESILTSPRFQSSSLSCLSICWIKNFTTCSRWNLSKASFPSLKTMMIQKVPNNDDPNVDDAADLDIALKMCADLDLWEFVVRLSGPAKTKWTRIIRSLSGFKELFSGGKLKKFELCVMGEVKDDIWNSGMENRLIEPLFTSMAEMSNVRFTGINPEGRTSNKIIKFCTDNKLPIEFQLTPKVLTGIMDEKMLPYIRS